MEKVYARKTVGWVGYGPYYTFALGAKGWFYETGSPRSGECPAEYQEMAKKWPKLGTTALSLAIRNGAVVKTLAYKEEAAHA